VGRDPWRVAGGPWPVARGPWPVARDPWAVARGRNLVGATHASPKAVYPSRTWRTKDRGRRTGEGGQHPRSEFRVHAAIYRSDQCEGSLVIPAESLPPA